MKRIADRRGWLAACLAVACLALPAMAGAQSAAKAVESYETHLGMAGIADATTPAVMGSGSVLATLNGQTLQIEGQYTGLNVPPTGAALMRGAGIGIPGAAIPNVTLTLDRGKISGAAKLSGDQVAALRAGHLYVQINSAKAFDPGGHLWGWLLPVHEKAGEDEPQTGSWFLPQGAGLSRNRN